MAGQISLAPVDADEAAIDRWAAKTARRALSLVLARYGADPDDEPTEEDVRQATAVLFLAARRSGLSRVAAKGMARRSVSAAVEFNRQRRAQEHARVLHRNAGAAPTVARGGIRRLSDLDCIVHDLLPSPRRLATVYGIPSAYYAAFEAAFVRGVNDDGLLPPGWELTSNAGAVLDVGGADREPWRADSRENDDEKLLSYWAAGHPSYNPGLDIREVLTTEPSWDAWIRTNCDLDRVIDRAVQEVGIEVEADRAAKRDAATAWAASWQTSDDPWMAHWARQEAAEVHQAHRSDRRLDYLDAGLEPPGPGTNSWGDTL